MGVYCIEIWTIVNEQQSHTVPLFLVHLAESGVEDLGDSILCKSVGGRQTVVGLWNWAMQIGAIVNGRKPYKLEKKFIHILQMHTHRSYTAMNITIGKIRTDKWWPYCLCCKLRSFDFPPQVSSPYFGQRHDTFLLAKLGSQKLWLMSLMIIGVCYLLTSLQLKDDHSSDKTSV